MLASIVEFSRLTMAETCFGFEKNIPLECEFDALHGIGSCYTFAANNDDFFFILFFSPANKREEKEHFQ